VLSHRLSCRHSLEEYLQDIVGDLPAEDRERVANGQTLNFAQAALVLQNSSNIYSRKVEYLYTLVYKALDELSVGQNASKKKKSSVADADIEDFLNFDPNQEFLLLDDILPTDDTDNCHKINLAEEPIDLPRSYQSFASPGSTARFSFGKSADRSVSSASAAAHRALIGSLDTGSLRLVGGACDIGEDGLLRMPGTHSTLPEHTPRERFLHTPGMQETEDTIEDGGDAYDDDEGGGGGFDLAGDFGNTPSRPPAPVIEEVNRRVTFAENVKRAPEKKMADPWDLLDPHCVDSQKPRPLRIGKTIRLPDGFLETPSECVTGARTRRITRREPVLKEISITARSLATETFKAALARKRSHDETNDSTGISFQTLTENSRRMTVPLTGLAFGNEFAYIAKAAARRRVAERRERRKQQLASLTGTMLVEGDMVDSVEENGNRGAFDGDEDDDDFGYDGAGYDGDGPVEGNTGLVSVDDAYKVYNDTLGTSA
jgi:hypothetical protein